MKELEQLCFELISHAGLARSSYIEAIQQAKEGDFTNAEKSMKAGRDQYALGHDVHFDLIRNEAEDEHIEIPLLLVHAEDQMMSAEAFGIIAGELIDSYRKIIRLEKIAATAEQGE